MVGIIHHAAVNRRESHRLLSDVDKLAKKFRVPVKRLWHIKIKALADSQQWPQLQSLGDSDPKPPIGFKQFAKAAIEGQQPQAEIMRYIDKVSSPVERHDLVCEAELRNQGVRETGSKLRDAPWVAIVRSSCNNPNAQRNDLLT